MEETTTAAAIELTDATFGTEVSSFDGIVLVDFWADWCTPCHVMSPRIAELAEKYKGNPKVKIAKLDVDHNEAVAMEHRVLSLPTFKLFHKGEIVDELIGAVPVDALDSMITRALGTAPAA